MIERYAVVSSRIHQELASIEKVVAQVERAIAALQQRAQDQDLYLDAAALNLHDFYAGLERIFLQIASSVDRNVPEGQDWHRELLRQMSTEISQIRPQVLSIEGTMVIDEYLRFRHVVRNIYAFEFDRERLETLASNLRPTFDRIRAELLAFASFLDDVAKSN